MFTDFEIAVVSTVVRVSFILLGLFFIIIGIIVSRKKSCSDTSPKSITRSDTAKNYATNESTIRDDSYSRNDDYYDEPLYSNLRDEEEEDKEPRQGILDKFWDDVTGMSRHNDNDEDD